MPRAVAMATRFWAATGSSLTRYPPRSESSKSFKIRCASAFAFIRDAVCMKQPTMMFSSTFRSPDATMI